MASFTGTKIKDTYKSILKVSDNGELEATGQEITDGNGNGTGVSLNTSGDVTATGTVAFGSLKDSGENITITKFVDEADGIGSNDNDSSIPTSAAVKDYVDNNITAQDLDISDGTNTGAVDLDSQSLIFTGDAGVSATVSGQTLTLDSSALQSQITSNDSDITALQAADVTLQSNIDAEETARISADTTLQSNIDSEASTRSSADSNLQSQITANDGDITTLQAADVTLQNNIDSEASTRASADTTLQSNIDAEASTRSSADTTLQGNIDTEEAARIAADSNLQSQITSNDTDISGLDSRLTTAEGNITSNDSDISGLDTRLTTAEGNITSNDSDISALQSGKQDINEKGQANGYASLDSGAKIPIAQIPDSIVGQVEYQGTWDASTDTPTLPSASTVKGHYYVVSTGGTYLGITYAVGDWIISNGTAWEKVDNTDAVTTVFGRLGAIVANESDYSGFYPLLSDLATTDANVATNAANIASNDTDISNLQSDKYDKTGGTISGNVTVTGDLSATNLGGTLSTAAQPNITSVGTLSGLAVSGDVTIDSTTLFVDSVNNWVGVGTTTRSDSATKFQITANASGVSSFTANADDVIIEHNSNVGITFASPNTTSQTIAFADPENVNAGFFLYDHSSDHLRIGTSGAEKLRIDSSGRVGIGTSSPSSLLHIQSNSSPTLTLDHTEKATWGVGDVIGKIDYYTSDASGNAPYSTAFIQSENETGAGTLPSGALVFGTATYNAVGGAVERLRITSSGNVGIGTSSPATKLHVVGDITFGDSHFIGDDASDNLLIQSSANENIIINSLDELLFRNSGTTSMIINASGKVGIGTSSPRLSLEVIGTDAAESGTATPNGAIMVGNPTAANSQFLTIGTVNGAGNYSWIQSRNSTQALFYNLALNPSGGNVGIGTGSPTAKLDVNSGATNTVAAFRSTDSGAYIGIADPSTTLDAGYPTLSVGAIGNDLVLSTSNAERMRITSGGDVAVGTTTATGKLTVSHTGNHIHINNSARASTDYWNLDVASTNRLYVVNQAGTGVYINNGGTSWVGSSDLRLKNIHSQITGGLDKVSQLNPVVYSWKNDEEGKEYLGLIAQEVEEIIPDVVSEDDNGYKGIVYTEIIPVLISAIQELRAEIESLKSQLS